MSLPPLPFSHSCHTGRFNPQTGSEGVSNTNHNGKVLVESSGVGAQLDSGTGSVQLQVKRVCG